MKLRHMVCTYIQEMSAAGTTPGVLRLVNMDAARPSRPRHAPARPVREIQESNEASARLDGLDARWVLAVRATMALEGGQAAILRPVDRRRRVALAMRLGLRPFDAALVIAVAQDAARTGEALSGAPQQRLAMIRPADGRRANPIGPGMSLFLAAALGALCFSLLKAWLLG